MSVFVDSRILIDAHDQASGESHRAANRLVRELWQLPVRPVISSQVCKDLWRALSRSGAVSLHVANQLVSSYLQWKVIPEDEGVVAAALELREKEGLSVRDACQVAAAQKAGVVQLWSDSLPSGRRFGRVLIRNPLLRDDSA